MRFNLVIAPVTSPYYMIREYVKNFGKIVFFLFDYIIVHSRMLKEVNFLVEIYVMSLGRAIIAYQFVEREVGRIVIFHFSSMIEHGKGNAPFIDSFIFITNMASQGSQ